MALTAQHAVYAEFSNDYIIVTNNAELTAAIDSLSTGSGGTVLVDGSAGPYQIDAHGLGSDGSPVLIQPLDPAVSPTVEQVDIYGSSHLTITGMTFDSSAIADTRHVSVTDVNIYNSNDIQFVNNIMDSTADAMWTHTNPPAESAITINHCQNIDILGNLITDYKNGIVYFETSGMDISENEISGLQGDALKGGGIEDVVVSNNYFHDFYGATQDINHSDMIQIFGTGRSIVSNNIEIFGNVMDNGDGAGTQGIFIRNEDWQQNGFFQNISIHDNVIYTAMPEGIGVTTTNGVDIHNNTVLWSQEASYYRVEGGTEYSMAPRIIVTNSSNASVEDNLVGDSSMFGVKLGGSNYIVNYHNPSATNYVGNHVVDFAADGTDNLNDLVLDSTSPLYGTVGAPMSSGSTAVTPTPTPSPAPAPAPTPTPDPDTGSTPDSGTEAEGTTTTAATQTTAQVTNIATEPAEEAPAEESETEDESGGFLASFFNAIANVVRAIFGRGSKKSTEEETETSQKITGKKSRSDEDDSLDNFLPIIKVDDHATAGMDDEDEDDFDLMAA